ncbi:MAG: hypothetical protein KAT68_16195, partial [Bacteroidales bacterium]|nr:hypothetical protein [Bacteroidales bacterium]
MKTKIKLTIVFLLITMLSFSQKGVINNGAKIVITSGAVLDIEGGADADYTNQSYNSSNHGRIDLDGKIKITGNWTNNANAGNNVLINMDTDGLILFNGSATQTIGGSTASYFEKFTLDNSSGALLGSEAKINGVFTLTNGLMTIGANNLLLGTSASIAGTPSASKMVVATGTGQLIKYYSSTGSFTFPVGDNTGTAEYSPLILNFISGTFGGSAYAAVNLSDLKHAQNSSSTDYITRYWSVDQYNISSFSCDLTATYLTVDIAGTESNLYSAQYDAPYWNILNAVNTSNNEISGTVSTFSDFTAAEQNAVSVLISIADDATLNESAEDGELITVTLSNDDFVGSLNSTNWTVTNLPEGVTKGTITRTGDKTATIALVGNRTKDYDTDITNLTVNIAHNEFVNMSSGSVEDDFGVTFNATNDDESISMTDDGITEGAEDGEIIT